ncbi:hypothetical protein TREMEDRAFT_32501 [Tremella mesenterica DSM 1558]|uniref:uncharacterized protein n=1 Tax=Tremella mesenterica (strain ATCC 24925 / CBS 8224 / DSM 1558 / NBRC 9311 / NRRL Y-6157 / RJB 2259-6 / UBC 559-6) TaxID=578456 RepID=UPI0003F4A592|nr:uncharacterized protein TREMEDRAFT_32501 [Tremella mesenterica DSM 1558]EIW68376.1 hypothetical protein TREMEDRAFT_32501 [Tremella mesenterica DSM 1558]
MQATRYVFLHALGNNQLINSPPPPPDPGTSSSGYDGNDQSPWTLRARAIDNWLLGHKVVASATAASLISTFAGFPLDSLKSRLQSSREVSSLPRLAAEVVREEGIGGLPLITISIVRTVSFTVYTSSKRILNLSPSDTPYTGEGSTTPWIDVRLGILNQDSARDVALTSMLAGGASGAVVCLGSAPFELVKVRRQLEYQIYRDTHPEFPGTSISPPAPPPNYTARPRPPPFVPPTTLQAVKMIISSLGPMGLYSGFRLHFIRDTLGTALYFAEYDTMRHALGRKRDLGRGKTNDEVEVERMGGREEQGELPDWAKGWLPIGFVPFLCGSLAGVTSWALIYPVDAIKTKAQQRALAGLEPRTALTQFSRLVRGTDKDHPKPLLMGIARLYRGLGVSMMRSMFTHGLLWTIVDYAGSKIDQRPFERWLGT